MEGWRGWRVKVYYYKKWVECLAVCHLEQEAKEEVHLPGYRA